MVRSDYYNSYNDNRVFVYDNLLKLLVKLKINFGFLDDDEILIIYDSNYSPIMRFELLNYSNTDLLSFYTLLNKGVINE